ncbi:uncharacterized protein FLJ43738-like [Watersipora subatra]|uniref:uncharacterized protein FLJ43738-like n=1 Tax=Watersipora subatra TaxID=2589382 RepID=UPI00355C5A7B
MCISRLDTPVRSVLDAFVSVSIDKDLLTPELTRELNPLSIKIKSVKNLPDEPVSYETLRKKCHPCSLSYDFFRHATHTTRRNPQEKNLYWDDLNVVLLGTLSNAQLTEYFLGPPMEVRVHDRDKLPSASVVKPALFGHDGEDEKINNVGYISGKRTRYNALKDRPASWDPYGVAKVNMADFLLGQKIINLQIPVHSCALPDILGRQAETGKVIGMPGSVDGPTDPPMPPGVYMDSHTMLKVKLEVAVPLTTTQEVAIKPYKAPTLECPFGRVLYIFDQKNKGKAKTLLSLISQINAKGLGLDSLSPVVLDAALSTYKLSAEQQTRKDLDIVTGFQLMDGKRHLFILEGLAEKAIQMVWARMSKPKEGVKVLYNSDLTFSRRLYGALDVDLTRVKLHEPIDMIVQQPLLFVRDMVPRHCFTALTKLDQLVNCADMRAASHNHLFPSADEIVSMSREFGVPLTADDLITDAEKSAVSEGSGSKSAIPVIATARPTRSRVQLKEPLDMSNNRYLEALKSRQMTAEGMDCLTDNIRTVMLESRQNRLRKHHVPVQHSAQRVAQNYSTSTFNSTELAKDMIRKNLDKDTLYTYNPEYHHSATFVPVNVEEVRKNEKLEQERRRVSKKDWTFPEVKTLQQCNEHSRRPDAARVDALNEEWAENLNHRNKLNPTLENRELYSWTDRRHDMDTWSYPAKHFEPAPEPPISIMLPGKKLQDEWETDVKKRQEVWQTKFVVEDSSMHFHRCNPQTEAIQRGPKASNELSKLESLLRDPAVKHSFAAPNMRTDIPPLRVVHYPSVDSKAREKGKDVEAVTAQMLRDEVKPVAFKPGPDNDRSWSMERNRVPAVTYDHAENGYFNLYHHPQHDQMTYKRHIHPLNETEYKSTYLFADPNEADASRQRHTTLQMSSAKC